MTSMGRRLQSLSRGFNAVACLSVMIMTLLTCADVALRLFGHPIPGTYEMIGFLGSIVIAFSLAYTSLEKGHISVEILVERLPETLRIVIDGIGGLVGFILFGLISWQSAVYAMDLRQSGEVSMTLQMPLYPFLFGMAVGCAMLCLVLLMEMIRSFRRIVFR